MNIVMGQTSVQNCLDTQIQNILSGPGGWVGLLGPGGQSGWCGMVGNFDYVFWLESPL